MQHQFCKAAFHVSEGARFTETEVEEDLSYLPHPPHEWNVMMNQRTAAQPRTKTKKKVSVMVLGKLLLITHSMGNLIASGAFASGICRTNDDNDNDDDENAETRDEPTKDLTWVSLGTLVEHSYEGRKVDPNVKHVVFSDDRSICTNGGVPWISL